MTRRSTAAAGVSHLGVPGPKVLATAVSTLVGLLLLGGCSFFSHSVTWTKSGVTEDQAQSDLAQCKEVADVQTERDRNIDRDIDATNNDANAGLDTSPIQNMQSYHDDRRYKSILRDCMTQLGYHEVE
jgi:hypothetical protein